MTNVTLAQAKARLSELLARVENGESFVITCRGRPVASLVAFCSPRHAPDWQAIRAFRESLPAGGSMAAELVRDLRGPRDEGSA